MTDGSPRGIYAADIDPRAERATLLIILLLSVALRIWGLSDRLPNASLGISPLDDSVVEETDRTEMYRAWSMWEGGGKQLSLDPGTAGWPGLSFYLTLLVQAAYRAAWTLGGADGASFREYFAMHPDRVFLAGRTIGVVLGTVCVLLVYRLGRRIAGPAVGFIAALLLAVNPLHAQVSQHVSDPNLLSTVFVLLAAGQLLRVPTDSGLRSTLAAGFFIGLGAGSKYVPAVLLLILYGQLAAARRAGTFPSRIVALRATVGTAAAAVAFLLASPFVLLHWPSSWAQIAHQGSALTSEWVGQDHGRVALGTYFRDVLPRTVTWPVYLASLGGLVLLVLRGRDRAVTIGIPVVIVLACGTLSVAQDRYILPVIPFLVLGSAVFLEAVHRWTLARIGLRRATFVGACALAGLAAWQLWVYADVRRALALPDSRYAARAWIQEHIAPLVPIGLDLYGPVFNSGRVERLAVTWPFYASNAEAVAAANSYPFLEGLKYYVVSDEVQRRYSQAGNRHARERAFQDSLVRHGVPVWSSASDRLGGPHIRVLELPSSISRSSERARAWDSTIGVPCDSARLAMWCGDLATIGAQGGRSDLAEEWSLRGAKLARGVARMHLLGMASEAAFARGDNSAALGILEHAIREYPATGDLHLLRGMALSRVGKSAEAIAEFQIALRLSPQRPDRQAIASEILRLEAR